MMFFYKDTVVRAKTREELLDHSECPICKNRLVYDWKMPLRYGPTALLRMVLIGGAFGTLLYLLLIEGKEKGWLDFLNQLNDTLQTKLVSAFLVCVCLPAAFFVILGEIKLGHWTRDNKRVCGLHCSVCGNGFAGLVGDDGSEEKVEASIANVSELTVAGQNQCGK